jgi:hypothetical protein
MVRTVVGARVGAACIVIAAGVGVGVALADGDEKTGQLAEPGVMECTPFTELQWERVAPELGADSPEIAVVPGAEPSKATLRYLRAPRKIHIPRHWHSVTESVAVIQGAVTFSCDRCGHQVAEAAGDVSYIPARCVHQAWFSEGAVVLISTGGPFDLNWSEGPPTAKDVNVDAPVAANHPR